MLNRRRFILAGACLLAAPAIVRATSIMPVRADGLDLGSLVDTPKLLRTPTAQEMRHWLKAAKHAENYGMGKAKLQCLYSYHTNSQ